MNDTTLEDVPLYVPRPGSIPWRVLKRLQDSPAGTSISRVEICQAFDVDNASSIDQLLSLACSRDVLRKGRNVRNDLVWKLGEGKFVIEDKRPIEETPAAPVVATSAPTVRPGFPWPYPQPQEQVERARPPIATRWVQVEPGKLEAATPAPAPAPASQAVDGDSIIARQYEGAFTPNGETHAMPTADVPTFLKNLTPSAAAPTPAVQDGAITIAGVKDFDRSMLRDKAKPAAAKADEPQKRLPAKPYLAQVRRGPLPTAEQLELDQYLTWLGQFEKGDMAVFRLAQQKQVEVAVAAYTAHRPNRFRLAKLSRYQAGIERIA